MDESLNLLVVLLLLVQVGLTAYIAAKVRQLILSAAPKPAGTASHDPMPLRFILHGAVAWLGISSSWLLFADRNAATLQFWITAQLAVGMLLFLLTHLRRSGWGRVAGVVVVCLSLSVLLLMENGPDIVAVELAGFGIVVVLPIAAEAILRDTLPKRLPERWQFALPAILLFTAAIAVCVAAFSAHALFGLTLSAAAFAASIAYRWSWTTRGRAALLAFLPLCIFPLTDDWEYWPVTVAVTYVVFVELLIDARRTATVAP